MKFIEKQIFIATPSDVQDAVDVLLEVIGDLNRVIARDKGLILKPVHWTTDSIPAYGSDAQDLLNDQIGNMEEVDLFIMVFWNRFGTPTPRAESGSLEEFDRAVTTYQKLGKPEIRIYFCQEPSNLTSPSELDQKKKVLEFRAEVQQKALTVDFDDLEKFRERIRSDLESWIVSHNPERPVSPVRRVEHQSSVEEAGYTDSRIAPQVLSSSGPWILIGGGFYQTKSVEELGNHEIEVKIRVDSSEQDAALRGLLPEPQGIAPLIPFAFQNRGDLVRVKSGTRTSAEGEELWTVTLRVEQSDQYAGFEMAVAGMSADEIAERRARFILLDEDPFEEAGKDPMDLNQIMIGSFVRGIDTPVKAEAGLLPELWIATEKDAAFFLPVARLWSVFHLITSGCCEQILKLDLGPIKDGELAVSLRGRRKRQYVNKDPYVIEIEGTCKLD